MTRRPSYQLSVMSYRPRLVPAVSPTSDLRLFSPSSRHLLDFSTSRLLDSSNVRSSRSVHCIDDRLGAGGDRVPGLGRYGAAVDQIAAERDGHGAGADELPGILHVDATGRDQLQLRQGTEHVAQVT